MTPYEQLKLIYNQFFNLADEVKKLIEDEQYNEANSKIKYKEQLIQKLLVAKNSINFDENQKEEVKEIEQRLMKKELENINFLKQKKATVAKSLKKTKDNTKLNDKYLQVEENQGALIDYTE